jgi:Ca2+-binding EF-hand superfamily protein
MRGHRMGQRGHGPFGPMGGGPLARRADADADGAISSAEWQAFVGRLDADGDGEIVFEEWHAAGPGDREPRPERFEMILRHFDANDDGVLETADFDALFAELDADASGAIEADELPRHHFRHRRG